MNTEQIFQHAFISYSRTDLALVDRIVTSLESANVPIWIDRAGIPHDSKSFENAIRQALDEAFTAILIATPNSLKSDYVQGELDIIRERNIPLIIVWADGERFTDTVPTFLTRVSYLDLRPANYEAYFPLLLKEITRIRVERVPRILTNPYAQKCPTSHLSIEYPKYSQGKSDNWYVFAEPDRFDTFSDFLNLIYLEYLKGIFPPFTYGSHWVIGSRSETFQRLVLPFNWLNHADFPSAITEFNPSWAINKLNFFGLHPNTHWQIIKVSQIDFFGLITKSDEIVKYIDQMSQSANPDDSRFIGLILNKILAAYGESVPLNPVLFTGDDSHFVLSMRGEGGFLNNVKCLKLFDTKNSAGKVD